MCQVGVYYFFINDNIFGTFNFKYFFSGASMYLLEEQINLLKHQLTGLNALFGLIISFIVLIKTNLFNFLNIVFYYISLIFGVIVIIVSIEIIKQIL